MKKNRKKGKIMLKYIAKLSILYSRERDKVKEITWVQ